MNEVTISLERYQQIVELEALTRRMGKTIEDVIESMNDDFFEKKEYVKVYYEKRGFGNTCYVPKNEVYESLVDKAKDADIRYEMTSNTVQKWRRNYFTEKTINQVIDMGFFSIIKWIYDLKKKSDFDRAKAKMEHHSNYIN